VKGLEAVKVCVLQGSKNKNVLLSFQTLPSLPSGAHTYVGTKVNFGKLSYGTRTCIEIYVN
jgi:hypothetical protein